VSFRGGVVGGVRGKVVFGGVVGGGGGGGGAGGVVLQGWGDDTCERIVSTFSIKLVNPRSLVPPSLLL